MHNPITQLLQRRALHQAVRRALDSGIGFYRRSWNAMDLREGDPSGIVLAWCRDVLGSMHRPYGVDSVSLALVVQDARRMPLASSQLAMLRPIDFYAMGQAESEARRTVQAWLDGGVLSSDDVRLSAVLFSWGDLTQELVLAG